MGSSAFTAATMDKMMAEVRVVVVLMVLVELCMPELIDIDAGYTFVSRAFAFFIFALFLYCTTFCPKSILSKCLVLFLCMFATIIRLISYPM